MAVDEFYDQFDEATRIRWRTLSSVLDSHISLAGGPCASFVSQTGFAPTRQELQAARALARLNRQNQCLEIADTSSDSVGCKSEIQDGVEPDSESSGLMPVQTDAERHEAVERGPETINIASEDGSDRPEHGSSTATPDSESYSGQVLEVLSNAQRIAMVEPRDDPEDCQIQAPLMNVLKLSSTSQATAATRALQRTQALVVPERPRRKASEANTHVNMSSRLSSTAVKDRIASNSRGNDTPPPSNVSSKCIPKGAPKCLFKQCEVSIAFISRRDRDRHMDSHFNDRFRCSSCQRTYNRKDACMAHSRKYCRRAVVEVLTDTPHWKDPQNRHLLKTPPPWDHL